MRRISKTTQIFVNSFILFVHPGSDIIGTISHTGFPIFPYIFTVMLAYPMTNMRSNVCVDVTLIKA
jgi:hypothetical protein